MTKEKLIEDIQELAYAIVRIRDLHNAHKEAIEHAQGIRDTIQPSLATMRELMGTKPFRIGEYGPAFAIRSHKGFLYISIENEPEREGYSW